MGNKSLNYKDAGVDINAGNKLVDNIKAIARKTQRTEVLGGLGGFGALFELPLSQYQQPVLVSATDGVGTKLKLAMQADQHRTIGIDLVAMCVNDLIVQGAEPLFFLDYYATGKLSLEMATDVISGIGEGCQQAGCALIGGETAEMPGMYQGSDYDLAGFSVGIVEKNNIIDGSKVQNGDVILGLASSGTHSNGYSLIRKIIEINDYSFNYEFNGNTLANVLLTPTRIYVKSILKLLQQHQIHAISHITGGGLLENIPRVLPKNCQAIIDHKSWQRPAIFQWLQQQGNISEHDMHLTFNCGIGMVVIVSKDIANDCIKQLTINGETVYQIGEIVPRDIDQTPIIIK